MENASGRGAPHMLRMLLVGVSTALGAAALSVALSASPASADDGSGGLLGTIGSTVNQVTDTVDGVVGTVVSPTLEHVTETVAPVTQVVTDVAPAPVAEVVTTTTETVSNTVSEVVDTADSTVGSTVDTVGDVVTDVAGSGVVGKVVAPVVDTVQTVPVVGDMVSSIGLGDLLSGVTDAVDAALPVIVGTLPPISPVIPTIPGVPTVPGSDITTPIIDIVPAEIFSAAAASDATAVVTGILSTDPSLVPSSSRTAPSSGAATVFSATSTGEVSAAVAGAQSAPSGPQGSDEPLATFGASTGTSSSASGNSGSGGVGAATAGNATLFSAALLLDRRTVVDDDLPGTPVFGTDVSPD